MAKRRKSSGEISFRELDAQEARREFNKKRGRGSKYDPIIEAADRLSPNKAMIVEGISYSEVTGLRMRMRNHLEGDYKIESTKVDRDKNLFDLLVQKK
jgi:hypothetical protein